MGWCMLTRQSRRGREEGERGGCIKTEAVTTDIFGLQLDCPHLSLERCHLRRTGNSWPVITCENATGSQHGAISSRGQANAKEASIGIVGVGGWWGMVGVAQVETTWGAHIFGTARTGHLGAHLNSIGNASQGYRGELTDLLPGPEQPRLGRDPSCASNGPCS